jgi:hypothetical protein
MLFRIYKIYQNRNQSIYGFCVGFGPTRALIASIRTEGQPKSILVNNPRRSQSFSWNFTLMTAYVAGGDRERTKLHVLVRRFVKSAETEPVKWEKHLLRFLQNSKLKNITQFSFRSYCHFVNINNFVAIHFLVHLNLNFCFSFFMLIFIFSPTSPLLSFFIHPLLFSYIHYHNPFILNFKLFELSKSKVKFYIVCNILSGLTRNCFLFHFLCVGTTQYKKYEIRLHSQCYFRFF